MTLDLSKLLVIGISSRALFDLEAENRVFEAEGLEAYRAYQKQHRDDIPIPGTAFPLVKALLQLNDLVRDRNGHDMKRLVEVVLLSRNSPEVGLRIFNAIEHYDLDITRGGFAGGRRSSRYFEAFEVDLFLSRSPEDVLKAHEAGVAAAVLYDPPDSFSPLESEIRIAFDGDAVLFSEESERIFEDHGLDAFIMHEICNARKPLPEGPFGKLLKTLATIQALSPPGESPLRLALVTARSSPTLSRVLHTLEAWEVSLDEVFFLGGVGKSAIIKAFRPHIFFDDRDRYAAPASRMVPAGRVPSSLEA